MLWLVTSVIVRKVQLFREATMIRNKIDLITNAAKLTQEFFDHDSSDHHYHPDDDGKKKKPFKGRRRKRGKMAS